MSRRAAREVTGSPVFWYASRATGIVTLLLLTAVLVLGLVVNRQGRLPGLPGFAVTSLHRNLSLLAYVSWPAALAHGIGASKDLQHGWLPWVAVGCALLVLAAVAWRNDWI